VPVGTERRPRIPRWKAEAATVPGGSSFAGGVHENAAHHLSADGEEVGLAFPSDVLNIDQFQVHLMDQRGGLEGVLLVLAVHEVEGEAAEFLVHARSERIERGRVAVCPGQKKLRSFRNSRVHEEVAPG